MGKYKNYVVLVDGCHTHGHLGVIRSLGRAGFKVVASSPRKEALGFYSHYADVCLISPAYTNHAAVQDWLSETVTTHGINLIIPTEGLLLSLRSAYEKFRALLPLSGDPQKVYAGYSKYALFCNYASADCTPALRHNLPNYVVIGEDEEFSATLKFTQRCYVKVDAVNAKESCYGSQVIVCDKPQELPDLVHNLKKHYTGVVIQEHHSGVGTGVFFVRWAGRIVTSFMYRGIHEVPHTGGTSSLRMSWWHQKQFEDALGRVEDMNWQGVIMFEYRWDENTDEFVLIEVNARFWMSLHVALYAGLDMPLALASKALGLPATPIPMEQYPCWKQGVKSQLTLPLEIGYLWSCMKDRKTSPLSKLKRISAFAVGLIDPRIKSDLAFPGDRKVCWMALRQFLRELIGSKVSNSLLARAWRKLKRFLYYHKRLLVYRVDLIQIENDSKSEMKINAKEHFKAFGETERWFNKASFMRKAKQRIERGEKCYSHMEDGTLMHFGWMVPRQKRAFLSDVGMEYNFPDNTSVLYNFYTHPKARGRGLYYRNLKQMLYDCCYKLKSEYAYLAVLKDNAVSCHVVEKAGFRVVAQMHETNLLGFKWRWSEFKQ